MRERDSIGRESRKDIRGQREAAVLAKVHFAYAYFLYRKVITVQVVRGEE